MTNQRLQLQELAHTAMAALINSSTFQPVGASKETIAQWVADVCVLSHRFAIGMMKTEEIVINRKMVKGLEEKKDEQ
jgi:hypothetical protein